MERKISTQSIKVGMYVSNLDRPWLDTPFLLQGFEIKDDEDIVTLQQHCEYIFIDTDRGSCKDIFIDDHTPVEPPKAQKNYIEEFLEGGKQKVVYEIEKNEFQEIPAAEVALDSATTKVANIMDNIKAGDNLDLKLVRSAIEPLIDSMIRNSDAMLWLSEMRDKDAYTYSHSMDNCALGIAFGRHLGLYKEDLRNVSMGLLLMDVGKMRVPDEILSKTTTLTRDEFREMQNHVRYGLDILRSTPGINDTILNIVQMHHERYDGSGYPNGLKGKEISVFGRISSIIDCYTAMTSDSPYRKAMAPHTALQTMYGWRNKYFQDELVEQFLQCLGVYPTGSLVEMSTGEVGIVIAQNKKYRLKPKLMMILSEHKEHLDGPRIVDLEYEAVDSTGAEYVILHGLEPGAFGINMSDYKF